MAKELPGRVITRFVSGGPKNYAIEHTRPDGTDRRSTVKIRGFELTAAAERKLNFDNMLRLVLRKFGPNRFDNFFKLFAIISKN